MNDTTLLDDRAVSDAITLRHLLHRQPEVSHRESATARTIVGFLADFQPDEIVTGLGGTGVAALFNGAEPGPTLLFRSELDALPIQEINDFPHRSEHAHVSHKCGHDGHMAMVAGLAPSLRQRRPNGRVVLLFQPAEETGDGAAAIRRDPQFQRIAPDHCFAIHNLPGYPLHQVVSREGTFAMASVGMQAKLVGRTSHASQPELGLSPVNAVIALLQGLPTLTHRTDPQTFRLATLTHLVLGERSFGIAAGEAEVLATLRAATDAGLRQLREQASDLVNSAAQRDGLTATLEWHDEFAATVNDPYAVLQIKRAAAALGLSYQAMETSQRWSEDFGLFTQISKGAMFGLGAGTETPALHSPDYDFPDALIATGIGMYRQLIDLVLGEV